MTALAARRRFKRFHGREPEANEIGVVRGFSSHALKVGELSGVIYETPSGQTYIHRIKANSRPSLFVSADGSQMFVLGGRTIFNERGFVDKPRRK